MIPADLPARRRLPEVDVSSADRVRTGLTRAAEALAAEGVPVPTPEGKLLRPLVAYAMVPPELRSELDARFWSGALAVQMVHEASLLHDDVLDGASERRGEATLVARRGVGPALVLGDHYLTGAYRAAAAAGASSFLLRFIRAVERTVAGEVAQGRATGRRLSPSEYVEIVRGKSGELFGAAACLGAAVLDLGGVDERVRFGRDLGTLYQKVDDLLDYCPAARTGKPPLQDHGQRKWTWILGLAGIDSFERDPDEVVEVIFRPRGGRVSAAREALAELGRSRDDLLRATARLSPGDTLIQDVLDHCLSSAHTGVQAQEAALVRDAHRDSHALPRGGDPPGPIHPGHGPEHAAHPGHHLGHLAPSSSEGEVVALAREVGGPDHWPEYFGRHARTFRFASRLFPQEAAARVRGVYAYCRFTDDLVDEPRDGAPASVLGERLEAWRALSRAGFEGHGTGVPLLDVVLAEAGERGVSWRYVDALLAGVGMDLGPPRWADWAALEEYTFGVAGSVGGWITQLFGIFDESLLNQAHALGHAMQLTNIVRDVGEDLERGRVYLPAGALAAHGLEFSDLFELRRAGPPVPDAYRSLVEEAMARADAWYDQAWPGIRALPAWYRRPVAVAARAYRGIHAVVRRNGYDNLTRRASTSLLTKATLGAIGLAQSSWRPVWPARSGRTARRRPCAEPE